MAKVGPFDSRCNPVEELCGFHNKLKGVFFRKMKHFMKNTYMHFVKYSQSTQNFDSTGKMASLSSFTAITSHVERSNIYRFWLVSMTNNSCNSSIRRSLITFLIGYREAIKILTVAK